MTSHKRRQTTNDIITINNDQDEDNIITSDQKQTPIEDEAEDKKGRSSDLKKSKCLLNNIQS